MCAWTGCVGLAEYRLDELSRLSGVSARNIRAYRERGLLDPPRREGRSAYYEDIHLAQLETIDQLLRKGFNSAHIAEFFASMREGTDLADALGLRRSTFSAPRPRNGTGPAPEATGAGRPTAVPGLDPEADEVRRLRARGVVRVVDGMVVLVDPVIGRIVARAPDKASLLRAIGRIHDTTDGAVDQIAAEFVAGLRGSIAARTGRATAPGSRDEPEVSQIVRDYGELADAMLADRLRAAVRGRIADAAAGYLATATAEG